MSYKQYTKNLEKELEAYKYFCSENLELLKISVDLSTVHNELWERAIKFKGKEGYDELMCFVNKLAKAKEGYDRMYTQYKYASVAFSELRVHTLQLADVVNQYEREEELAKQEL